MKVHEPATSDERTGMQQRATDHAAAHSDVPQELPEDAAARNGTQERLGVSEENAALRAEVKVLREMIGKFEKFADQAVEDKQLTLETFQTMAIGGRLERRKSETSKGEVIRATTPDDNIQN